MESQNIRRIPRFSGFGREFIKRYPRRAGVCFAVIVLFIIAYCCRNAVFVSFGQFLNVGKPLVEPVDDVLILGGDLQTRPFVGAEVYLAGFAERVLVVTVKRSTMMRVQSLPNDAAVTVAILKYRGVPDDAIHVLDGEKVDSTRDEAQLLKGYLAEHPDRKVAIVTNDFHTRRARMIFERVAGQNRRQLEFVSAPTDGFSPSDWHYFRQGWATYMLEYLKLSYHWLTLRSQ